MDVEDPNLIDCPECGARVSLAWSRCPECGLSFYPGEEPEEAPARRAPQTLAAFTGWLARSLITLLVIGGLLGAFGGLALGLNWVWMMIAGLLLFSLGWGLWGWLRRRGR